MNITGATTGATLALIATTLFAISVELLRVAIGLDADNAFTGAIIFMLFWIYFSNRIDNDPIPPS